MRRRTKWIALGLVVAMCATATVGAVSMAEEQSDPTETVSAEEAVEAEAPEADVEEEEIQETEAAEETETAEDTEAAEEKTDAAEENTEAEAEEAEENVIEYVAIPYDTEDVWGQIAITNSDLVDTALNIRSTADEDGEIIGFLYKGAAAWVIDTGDEWTEIYSNGLTGYVQNDYLLFGDDVEEIADYYNVKGVRAEWDGVVVYSSTEDLTELGEMNSGDSYPVIDDEDEHWVEIQYNADESGYVSADDVSFVMLFEAATPKDGERLELVDAEEESTEEESETDEEDASEEDSEDSKEESSDASETASAEEYTSSEDDVYYEETYVEEYSTPSYSSSSYSDSYSSSSSSSSSSYSDSYSSSSSSDSSTTETEAADTTTVEEGTTISSDYAGGSYYDANTDTYYDENGVAILSYDYYEEDAYDDEYYDDDDEYYEEEEYYEYEEETYDDYTVYEDSSYVEDVYVEDYSEGVSYSSDDSTLMASLIYCEAGNQPYEGMVAVGAVVMNRVDSSSFPDTISDVIYQSGQFTPAYNGMLDSALSSGVGDIYYSAADDAMSGEDPTDGALYFNTSHGSGLKIGDHWFY